MRNSYNSIEAAIKAAMCLLRWESKLANFWRIETADKWFKNYSIRAKKLLHYIQLLAEDDSTEQRDNLRYCLQKLNNLYDKYTWYFGDSDITIPPKVENGTVLQELSAPQIDIIEKRIAKSFRADEVAYRKRKQKEKEKVKHKQIKPEEKRLAEENRKRKIREQQQKQQEHNSLYERVQGLLKQLKKNISLYEQTIHKLESLLNDAKDATSRQIIKEVINDCHRLYKQYNIREILCNDYNNEASFSTEDVETKVGIETYRCDYFLNTPYVHNHEIRTVDGDILLFFGGGTFTWLNYDIDTDIY